MNESDLSKAKQAVEEATTSCYGVIEAPTRKYAESTFSTVKLPAPAAVASSSCQVHMPSKEVIWILHGDSLDVLREEMFGLPR